MTRLQDIEERARIVAATTSQARARELAETDVPWLLQRVRDLEQLLAEPPQAEDL